MKKIILASLYFLLICSFCFAKASESSPGYTYAYSVIETLGICDQAMSTQYGEDEAPDSIVSKMSAQNATLERAKSGLSGYLESEDFIAGIGSRVITKIINDQIALNNKQLEIYEKYKDKSEEDFTEDEWNNMVSELGPEHYPAWKSVVTQAQFAAYNVIVMPKTGTPTGKIPSKISKSEMAQLVKKIDGLFGSRIQEAVKNADSKQYDAYEPRDNLLYSAYRMRNTLDSSTFEEMNRKNKLWGISSGSTTK